MISPWHNPLPLEEYITDRVVIYFYSGRWVPITYSSLAQAIALYHRGKALGHEILLFPPNIKPLDLERFLDSVSLAEIASERNLNQEHSDSANSFASSHPMTSDSHQVCLE